MQTDHDLSLIHISINSKVNAILSQKEKVVELSWWDLHKDKAYIIIALIIVEMCIRDRMHGML